MLKNVYGVGVNDRSIPCAGGGKNTKIYNIWRSMLRRAYSEAYQANKPTYIGCSVSDNFKYYHLFHAWCQTQVGFGVEGYQLDKDILIKGNKVYSESTCIFVPSKLNNLFTKHNSARGTCPIGVRVHGNRFQARGRDDAGYVHLGTFDSAELAFFAYKVFKEAYIKKQAERYRDVIDVRAYEALMNYSVDIGD